MSIDDDQVWEGADQHDDDHHDDDDDHHDDENNDADESNDANYQDTVAHNWRLVIQSAQERDTASYLCQVIKVVMMMNLMIMMMKRVTDDKC